MNSFQEKTFHEARPSFGLSFLKAPMKHRSAVALVSLVLLHVSRVAALAMRILRLGLQLPHTRMIVTQVRAADYRFCPPAGSQNLRGLQEVCEFWIGRGSNPP